MEKLKNETIREILERHYDSVDFKEELPLGDIENDIEYKIQQARDKQKEEIKEKANAYDEDGEEVKIFWS